MKLTLLTPHHKLIGHRGAARYAPENTLASFQLAAEKGLNWVEFDVRLTKDGQLVIFHDETLERTTMGKGFLRDYTLAELQKLDAGSWFAPEFKNQKIPSLVEAIPFLIKLGITPNIEIKCEENQDRASVKKLSTALAECLTKHWPASHYLPLVSSFDHDAPFYYRETLPTSKNTQAPIGFLVESVSQEPVELVKKTPNSALHCSQKYTTPQRVRELTEEGIPVLVYTVNDKPLAQAYLDAGAFSVFTDVPDLFS